MFKKIIFFLVVGILAGCGAKKKSAKTTPYKISVAGTTKEHKTTSRRNPKTLPKANDIINTALSFSGVRYKYGGTTKKGMDCSGLLYVSYGAHDVALPRVSYVMANEGKRIRLGQVMKGDLLFFKTSRRGKKINHVGMVVGIEKGEIKFIHASSSRGVTVSSLKEGYWKSAFVKATRVL